ncbi:MAG TPA: M56 family metallopeptidase, partial [Gemmataceae bacterium]|nr:M56 family metallopeptidase [Gemmataceae bacterium]
MNDLGTLLTWSALQTTLAAFGAAVVFPFAARRGPAAGAAVAAAGLAASVALTVLVFCPLPAWWDWNTPIAASSVPGGEVQPQAAPSPPVAGDAPAPMADGPSWPMHLLQLTRTRAGRAAAPFADHAQSGWAVAALLFLIGAAMSLLRLLGGLWAVSDLRRRGRPIFDASILELLRQLREEMGRRRPVELRESALLGAPAAAGWVRPVVFLPTDWRDWSRPELRAALAHELAHVRRSDYLLGVLARLGVALHFYHPLLYWLAGRLRLQLELAADALAAPAAGGRDAYLQGLARLALRLCDRRPAGWPANPLFSKGMFLRRIRMLKTRDGRSIGLASGWGRVLIGAALSVVVVGVSALRCPAQKAADPVDAKAAAPTAAAEPFDASCLPPNAMGVVFVRPSEVLSRPALKKYAEEIDKGIPTACKAFGLSGVFGLRVEEIAQVSAIVTVKTDKNAKKGQSSLLFGTPGMIRATRDFDWAKELKSLIPGVTESRHGDHVIYHFPTDGPLAPMMGGAKVCYYAPDSRTVVFDTEDGLVQRIEHPNADSPAWAADFRRIERGIAALVLDNRSGAWTRELSARDEPEPHITPFLSHTSWVVFGASADDGLACDASARFDSDEIAEKALKAIDGGLDAARGVLATTETFRAALGDGDAHQGQKEADDRAYAFFKALLQGSELKREGASVRLHGRAKGDLNTFLGAILDG